MADLPDLLAGNEGTRERGGPALRLQGGWTQKLEVNTSLEKDERRHRKRRQTVRAL